MSAHQSDDYYESAAPTSPKGDPFWRKARYGAKLIESPLPPDIVRREYTLESGRRINAAKTFDRLLAHEMDDDLRMACLWELTKRKPSKSLIRASWIWVEHLRVCRAVRLLEAEKRLLNQEWQELRADSLRGVIADPDAALQEFLDTVRQSEPPQKDDGRALNVRSRQCVDGASYALAPEISDQIDPDPVRNRG